MAQLEKIIRVLAQRHYGSMPLRPEDLRMHVGTTTTAANYWMQGIGSSSRVMELFQADQPLLDWGCGSGRTYRWLLPRWRQVYYGTDVDSEAVSWLKQYANVVACRDSPPLPYPPSTFGGVFAFSVLTHIHPNQHRAWYEEIYRVLKPGGRAYLTTQNITVLPEELRKAIVTEFSENGWTYLLREGHYKDAALVSESFTRQTINDLFIVETYAERGYNNMDAFLLRKPGG